MGRLFRTTFLIFLLIPAATLLAQDDATEVDPQYIWDLTEVDPQYIWDLTEIYPSLEAWEQARDEVLASFEEIEARRGTLGNSANDLYEVLALVSDITRKAGRVFTYAGLNADEDLRVPAIQGSRQHGLLILARTVESQRRLTRAFQRREIRKYYLAWVQGTPPVAGTIDLPLRKGRKSRFRVAGGRAEIERVGGLWHLRGASDDAKPAPLDGHASQTRFRRLLQRGTRSLVLLQPLTGRTHQLRVHIAWIGYPIMGDLLYGSPAAPAQPPPRPPLHCHPLGVPDLPARTADPRGVWLT